MSELRGVLSPNGICAMAGAPHDISIGSILAGLIEVIVLSRLLTQKFVPFIAKFKQEDLALLRDLMQTGKMTPVIDRCYTLAEVAEALRYLEEGHARGKVVITVNSKG